MLFVPVHRQLRCSEIWSVLSLFVLPMMLFSSVLLLLSLIQVSIAYTYFSHLFPAIKLVSQDAVFLSMRQIASPLLFENSAVHEIILRMSVYVAIKNKRKLSFCIKWRFCHWCWKYVFVFFHFPLQYTVHLLLLLFQIFLGTISVSWNEDFSDIISVREI